MKLYRTILLLSLVVFVICSFVVSRRNSGKRIFKSVDEVKTSCHSRCGSLRAYAWVKKGTADYLCRCRAENNISNYYTSKDNKDWEDLRDETVEEKEKLVKLIEEILAKPSAYESILKPVKQKAMKRYKRRY